MSEITPNPPGYTAGLGELIRAQRLYIGISQRGMAKHLNDMDRRSYQRIENGQDDCPPGLLDTTAALLDEFDKQVAAVQEAADYELANDLAHVVDGKVKLTVPSDPREEWQRCVIARAAVDGGHIMPVLTPAA